MHVYEQGQIFMRWYPKMIPKPALDHPKIVRQAQHRCWMLFFSSWPMAPISHMTLFNQILPAIRRTKHVLTTRKAGELGFEAALR